MLTPDNEICMYVCMILCMLYSMKELPSLMVKVWAFGMLSLKKMVCALHFFIYSSLTNSSLSLLLLLIRVLGLGMHIYICICICICICIYIVWINFPPYSANLIMVEYSLCRNSTGQHYSEWWWRSISSLPCKINLVHGLFHVYLSFLFLLSLKGTRISELRL